VHSPSARALAVGLMEIENLFRYPALAVGLMEIENITRYTELVLDHTGFFEYPFLHKILCGGKEDA
jgi:hypothetical protein